MRLTVEEDPESIRRYGHIKRARRWEGGVCAARCPGTRRTCTLAKRHRGPHVAHSRFNRVLAVWDAGMEVARSKGPTKPAAGRTPRGEVWTGGFSGPLESLRSRLASLTPSVGDLALLILFLGFVVFAVQWLRLIFT